MGYNSGKSTASVINTSGYALPSSTQEVHEAMIYFTTTQTYYQIATPDASYDYYVIGWRAIKNAAAGSNLFIFDAAAGNVPGIAANNKYDDAAGYIMVDNNAVIEQYQENLPVPYKVTNGIRACAGNAGAAGYFHIMYLKIPK